MPLFAIVALIGILWFLIGFFGLRTEPGSKGALIWAIIGFTIAVVFLIVLIFTPSSEFIK